MAVSPLPDPVTDLGRADKELKGLCQSNVAVCKQRC